MRGQQDLAGCFLDQRLDQRVGLAKRPREAGMVIMRKAKQHSTYRGSDYKVSVAREENKLPI